MTFFVVARKGLFFTIICIGNIFQVIFT